MNLPQQQASARYAGFRRPAFARLTKRRSAAALIQLEPFGAERNRAENTSGKNDETDAARESLALKLARNPGIGMSWRQSAVCFSLVGFRPSLSPCSR